MWRGMLDIKRRDSEYVQQSPQQHRFIHDKFCDRLKHTDHTTVLHTTHTVFTTECLSSLA